MAKELIRLSPKYTASIFRERLETGMGFLFCYGSYQELQGYFVLISSGFLFPLGRSNNYVVVSDFFNEELDSTILTQFGREGEDDEDRSAEMIKSGFKTSLTYNSRYALGIQKNIPSSIPPNYIPVNGVAFPLLGRIKLQYDEVYYRYCWTKNDPCYDQMEGLKLNSYLTSDSDHLFVNTGYGAVGRYSLPIPAPASYLFKYLMPAGVELLVGTVAPLFGQAGGGVEVKVAFIPSDRKIRLINRTKIDEY